MLIKEVSPNTLDGSFSNDLLLSKLWLITKLSNLQKEFDTIYVLGSWFGNLALLFAIKNIKFKCIINVDWKNDAIDQSRKLCKKLDLESRISHLQTDVNNLDYDKLSSKSVIINTSCNNIDGKLWFDNIPVGTLTVLQSRDQDPSAINKHKSLKDFSNCYPLSKVLYRKSIKLVDTDTDYHRYMIIGIK